MREYETVFIVKGELPKESVEAIAEKAKSIILQHQGALLNMESWGKRKLAYSIKGEREGTYQFLHFSATPQAVSVLERELRVAEGVIRFLTVHAIPKKLVPPPAAAAPTDQVAPAEQ